jgi:hypothetical protein
MRFDSGSRGHPQFNLDSGMPRGPKHIVLAAKDPVAIPTEPAIVEIAAKNLCVLGLGVQCFTLTNVYGIEVDVPYGATVAEWEAAARKLLEMAMAEDAQ